jgi:hypothetical protein
MGLVYSAAALFGAWLFNGVQIFNRDVPTLADRPLALGFLAFLVGASAAIVTIAHHHAAASGTWRDAVASVSFLVAAVFLARIELAHFVRDSFALALASAVTVPLFAALYALAQRLGRRRSGDDAAA